MNDKEEFQNRKDELKRKTRIYLYSGIILLGTGVCWLYYSKLGFILIAGGILMRILYYTAHLDLKAINKLEKQLKTFITLMIPLFLLLYSHTASALQPGQKAGELDRLEWLKGEPIKIFDEKKKIVIVELWATWDKGCQLAFPVLSAIQKKYTKNNVIIVGISKEKEEILKGFLNVHKKSISFDIARDPSGHTSDYYSDSDARIPLVLVIGKDGKVLWRGHPLELEPVLKKIIAGSFDLDKQIKISELHKQLQTSLQIENIQQVIQTTDKILGIDPSDDIAMRVRLFVFESKREFHKALAFINSQISKNPESASLYFIKLDMLERINAPVEKLHDTLKTILDKFKDKHEILHQLAWISVNRMRFGTAQLEIALNASKKSIEILIEDKEQDPEKLAIYLNTQAKIYYMIGALELAIANQEKVLKLQKSDPAEPASTQLLEYYKNILKLRNKEK